MRARFQSASVYRRTAFFRIVVSLSVLLFLTACNSGSDTHPVNLQSTPAVGILKDPPPEPRARVHTVTTVAGEGGAINPAVIDVSDGQSVLLTIFTEPGWELDSVSGCDGKLIAGHRYETDVLRAPCEVRASFVQQTHKVDTLVRSNFGGTTEGDGVFAHGAEVTVRAVPDDGFEFIAWTEASSVVSTDAEYTFTLNSNRSLSATFDIARNITPVSMPPAGVVTLFEAQNAPPGVLFAVTAESKPGDGSAGIWRSEDGGQSWTQVSEVQAQFISIGVDDPDLVMAGMIDGYLLSRDGGREWVSGSVGFVGNQPVRIVAGSLSSEAMYAASPILATPGLYRSLDGGETWDRVISPAQGSTQNIRINHVEISAADLQTVHAATGGNTNIWRSVDGGSSFFSIRTGIANDRPRVFDAGVRSDTADAAHILVENHVSVNGGADWTQLVLPPRTVELTNPDGTGPFEVVLGEDIVSPGNTVWMNGVLLRVSGNLLLVSRDDGLTWETLIELVGATGDFDTSRLRLAADALYLQLTGGPEMVYRIDLGRIASALED